MSAPIQFHDAVDAALALRSALDDMERLEDSKSGYEWSYPESLIRDQRDAANRIRSAIRFFAQPEAGEQS